MKLHLITAPDARTANERAVSLYGRDVLIVSSAQVNGTTELIVAADTTTQENEINGRSSAAVRTDTKPGQEKPKKHHSEQPAKRAEEAEFPETRFEDLIEPPKSRMVEKRQPLKTIEPETSTTASRSSKFNRGSSVKKKANQVRKRRKADEIQIDSSPARAQELVTMIRDEIHALRTEFNLSLKLSGWRASSSVDPALIPLLDLMVSTGMTAGLRSIFESELHDCHEEAQAVSRLESMLNDAARTAEGESDMFTGTHAFYGPSGTGKTTYIAKLANKLTQTVPAEKISLISFSDHRLGAWNQLQLLASRSGARCYRANDMCALQLIMDEIGHDSVNLIDISSTCSLDNALQVRASGKNIRLHSVIPANASLAALRKISCGNFDSTVLTKLDEVDYAWGLIHLMTESKLRISFCSMDSSPESDPVKFLASNLVKITIENIKRGIDLPSPLPGEMALPQSAASTFLDHSPRQKGANRV